MGFWIWLGILIASFVIGRIFRPKINTVPLSPGQFDLPTAEEDGVIPIVFGTGRVAPNIVSFGHVQSIPVKQNDQIIRFVYGSDMMMTICQGPIDTVEDIYIDNKSMKNHADPTTSSEYYSLIGSSSNKMCAQTESPAFPWAYSAGGLVGNGGITVSVTAGSLQIVASAALFSPSDVGRYIEIPGVGRSGGPYFNKITFYTDSTHVSLRAPGPKGTGGVAPSVTRSGLSLFWPFDPTKNGSVIFAPGLFGGGDSDGGFEAIFDFYFGSTSQVANVGLGNLPFVGGIANASGYRNIAYAFMYAKSMGHSPQIRAMQFVVKRCPSNLGNPATAEISGNANPAEMIYEVLTDTKWGLAIPTTYIDQTSFLNAAKTLFAEGLGMSMVIEQVQQADDIITEAVRHADAVLYTHPTTGLITLRLIRNPFLVNNLLQSPQDFSASPWVIGAGCTVTVNADVGPLNDSLADLLTFTTTSANNYDKQTYATLTPELNTFSFFISLKANTINKSGYTINIRRGDASESTVYNDATGNLVKVADEANGYARYKCVKTFGGSTVGDNVEVLVRNGAATGSFYAYNAQLYLGDVNEPAIPLVSPSNAKSMKFSRGNLRNTVNRIKVRFTNKANDYKTGTVQADDLANIQVTGGVRQETIDFLGLTNRASAQAVASRTLLSVSQSLAKGTWQVNRDMSDLYIGAPFALSWPGDGIISTMMRVTRIDYGALDNGMIEIDGIEDVFDTANAVYSEPAGSSWTEDSLMLNPNPAPIGVFVNPTDYGAKGDLQEIVGSISASSVTFTADSPVFVLSDVGKVFHVKDAGPNTSEAEDLITTILSYTSATVVVLANSATRAVSHGPAIFCTDDTLAWQYSIDAAVSLNQAIMAPDGKYGVDQLTLKSPHLQIFGSGMNTVLVSLSNRRILQFGMNKATDPSVEVGVTDFIARGSATITQDAVTFFTGTKSAKIVTTNVTGSGFGTPAVAVMRVVAGSPHVFSVMLEGTGAVGKVMEISVDWRDPSNVSIRKDTEIVTLTAGWNRYSASGVPPAGADRMVTYVVTSGAQGVFTFYADALIFEAGVTPSVWGGDLIDFSLHDIKLDGNVRNHTSWADYVIPFGNADDPPQGLGIKGTLSMLSTVSLSNVWCYDCRLEGIRIENALVQFDNLRFDLCGNGNKILLVNTGPTPPTALTLLSDGTTALQGSDGAWIRRIKLTWTNSTDPFYTGYDFQYKKTADTNWINAISPLFGDVEAYILGIEDDVSYDIRLRVTKLDGTFSSWATGTIIPSTPGISATSTPAKNLIRNGDAEFKKLVGWSGSPASWDVTSADVSPPNGASVFESSTNGQTALHDDYVPVDTEGAYELTNWAKKVAAGGAAGVYVGLACYDSQLRLIRYEGLYAPNGLTCPTTLAANVNPGDTVVHLTSAAGFPDESGSGFNTYVALNAADTGTDLPNFMVLHYTSKTGNDLNLTVPVPAGVSATSGTKVRFHRSGDLYTYCTMRNVLLSALPTTWTKYRGTVTKESALGAAPGNNEFRLTTAYVRLIVSPLSGGTGSNTVRFDDFTFMRLDQALWRGVHVGYLDGDVIAQNIGLTAANYVKNGSGQEGPIGVLAPNWILQFGPAFLVPDSSMFKTGDRCLSMTHSVASSSSNYQNLPSLEPGIYLFSCWMKNSGASGTPQSGLSIAQTGGSVQVLERVSPGVATVSYPALVMDNNGTPYDWTYCESIFRVVASGSCVLNAFHGDTGNIGGWIAFDSISIVKLPPGLWTLFAASGKLDSAVLQVGSDGVGRKLVKGKQTGFTKHKSPVTFVPAFAQAPSVRFRGGLTHEPRAMWGSIAACDGKVITAATTATPISCTCTGHGLATGAEVSIFPNGATAPGLNIAGKWTVTNTGANTFTLNGSVGAGTYAASSCNVSTGVTALSATLPERDYTDPVSLTASGFTTRALLHQRLSITLTARSVNFPGTHLSTIGATDAPSPDMGTNLPSYDDRYTVNVTGQITTTPKYGDGTVVITYAIDSNDGSGWVERLQSNAISDEFSAGLSPITRNYTDQQTITVSGMGANDNIRIRIISIVIAGGLISTSVYVAGATGTPAGITWSTAASSDQYASKTPDAIDDILWEAEGYI